ncbi:hypothetical protein [Clostridium sp. DL1XJH146]
MKDKIGVIASNIELKKSIIELFIVLIIWNEVFFNCRDWKEFIDSEIDIEKFAEPYEIELRVKKYLDKKDDVVIVSSGIACGYARTYGMNSVFISASCENNEFYINNDLGGIYGL